MTLSSIFAHIKLPDFSHLEGEEKKLHDNLINVHKKITEEQNYWLEN